MAKLTYGGGGAGGRGAHPSFAPAVGKVTVRQKEFAAELSKLIGSMTTLQTFVAQFVSKALIDFAYDLLFDAVDACPYETGALRESGKATLIVAGGRRLPVVAVSEADKSGYFSMKYITKNVNRYSKRLALELSFQREVKGFDLALWTHEELLPYPKGQKGLWYARKPGTGPKYLENAWNIHKYRMIERLEDARIRATRAYKNRHKDLVR